MVEPRAKYFTSVSKLTHVDCNVDFSLHRIEQLPDPTAVQLAVTPLIRTIASSNSSGSIRRLPLALPTSGRVVVTNETHW